MHLTSGGSEAVEMALKMLRVNAVASGQPRRHRVLSLFPGYHGATVQTLGLNGDLSAPEMWGPMTVLAEKIPAPLTFRAASSEVAAADSLLALEEAIARVGPDEVLAFVMEPIGGQASGVNVPHPSFARGREPCATATGSLSSSTNRDRVPNGDISCSSPRPERTPDLIVLAKGLGGGYAPLGAVLARASLVDHLAETVGFVVSHSYDVPDGGPRSAVLDEIVERDLVPRRIGSVSGYERGWKAWRRSRRSSAMFVVAGCSWQSNWYETELRCQVPRRRRSRRSAGPAWARPWVVADSRRREPWLIGTGCSSTAAHHRRTIVDALLERLRATLAGAVDELCTT